jgi:hypothetical protein
MDVYLCTGIISRFLTHYVRHARSLEEPGDLLYITIRADVQNHAMEQSFLE